MSEEPDPDRVDDPAPGDAPEDRRGLSTRELIDRLREAKRAVDDEGRPDAVASQHDLGKRTARERIDYLLDDGTFEERGKLAGPAPSTPETAEWEREDVPADGVVTGFGEVDGRPVAVVATDFTVKGGSLGHTGGGKIRHLGELALRRGVPFVMLHDGGGHRIQEGLDSRTFARGGDFVFQTRMSGWVPQVTAMMGPGFAAPTNYAGQADFIPMVEGEGTMGVAGPALVQAALGRDFSKQELGGAEFQTAVTGMADRAFPDDEACLDAIRTFLSYLPRNARRGPPEADWEPPSEDAVAALADVIPNDTRKGYDIYAVVEGVVDRGSLFELKPRYARNVVTGFARLEGKSIGVVANNPRINAGTFDVPACDKASRFVGLCDAFGLPLLFLADVPGVLPGPDSERAGIARHAGKVLFEVNRATVPKASIVLRRGYGFGYVLMAGGRSTENELTAVWPTAEIAAMGIEGAVDVAYRREIEAADDPAAKREALISEFLDRTGAIRAVEGFGVDAAIDPRETREWVARAFDRADEPYEPGWPPKKRGINPI